MSPLPLFPITPESPWICAIFPWLDPFLGLPSAMSLAGCGQEHCGIVWWCGVTLSKGKFCSWARRTCPLSNCSWVDNCLLLCASSSTTVKSAPVMILVCPCCTSQVQMASTEAHAWSLKSECIELLALFSPCLKRLECGQKGEFPVHSVGEPFFGERLPVPGESKDLHVLGQVQKSLVSWLLEWRWWHFGEQFLWDLGECLLLWWFFSLLCDKMLSWRLSRKLFCLLPGLLRWLLWLPSLWWFLAFDNNLERKMMHQDIKTKTTVFPNGE